jgi:hypothetical protein
MPTLHSSQRAAHLAGCAILALGLGGGTATAGCNSGNVANTSLLSDAACQAAAPGANALAVGPGANASGVSATALAHRLNITVPLIVHGSFASAGPNEHVGRAGVALEF